MTLIKSISGIRGTIGGIPGEGLSPIDIVKFTAAYGTFIKKSHPNKTTIRIVIGRDARPSGEMCSNLVASTLSGLGIHVTNLGLATTPTVEMAVPKLQAQGGIILTASHNPKQWNALKLLNDKGEFISDKEGKEILDLAESNNLRFAEVDQLGKLEENHSMLDFHISEIMKLPYVNKELIEKANFTVVVDAVNSVGGIAVPAILNACGVKHVITLHCEPNGEFPHNPEPLPEHLKDLSEAVVNNKAHIGISVDPDVDRLALVCENGAMFGEEYTLVSVADHVLSFHPKGNTVSNLSSTRALRDVTEAKGGKYFASAVGEVNVVKMMKDNKAVIGGEGNGGVILPELHYGRDALVGIAMFLTLLAKSGKSASELRASYPEYQISKNKIELTPGIDVDKILSEIQLRFKEQPINTVDGVKIEFGKEWVHLRKSNTEPIIRIYSESENLHKANSLAEKIMNEIKSLV